jgi:hypothetical protein
VRVVRDCVGATLVYVGDSWNVWENFFFKSAIPTYVDVYIHFFIIFTCLKGHNSCGRITVSRLVVLFDLVLSPGGSVGSEQPMCSSKQSSYVVPIGGNATFKVLCRNRRLLLSEEASTQFGYELTMDSLWFRETGSNRCLMCHRDLQRAMITCPFGPIMIIPEVTIRSISCLAVHCEDTIYGLSR